ncbi:MAG: nitrate transporter ATP-binding protein [Mucilaginibacter sp.]|nr:nitrate transporter ATP-binding protein [Mucilaginibacter sp.]
MEPIIAIKNLSVNYGVTTVIEDFSLEIGKGEIIGLFGPSGCGKSTVLKCILGILEPASGTVTIKGIPAKDYGEPLAYTPQINELLAWKSVSQNVELWHRESIKKIKQMYALPPAYAVDHLELNEAAGKLPGQLSGGMERRSALARCLATNSDIMILDEAFISIERSLRRKIMFMLRKHIREAGITAILISHDFEESTFMSDRLIVLTPGPAVIQKEIRIALPADRDIAVFDSPGFMEQSKLII